MEDLLTDKIKGVLFGQAVGDALGLGTEFMTKAEVLKYYPQGLNDYSQIIQDFHRSRWRKGDWTDDTDMMLCIANAIVQDRNVDVSNIAWKFKGWHDFYPIGIGRNTNLVLSFGDYVTAPMKAAELVWTLYRRESAGNGGVMRTSIVGLWKNDIEKYAAEICRLTHYDPRCVGSCVIISLLVHSLVYHNQVLPLKILIEIGEKYDSRIKEYIIKANNSNSLDDLALDDATTMGYTLKTMAAALWCLYHCDSFKEALLLIANAGGDADTNAAVTCSLLGAKFGYSNIPEHYVYGLVRKDYLTEVVNKIINVLCVNE